MLHEKNIPYKSGHYCTPNGAGDFSFICPERGEKPGFIPYFIAFILTGTCACGKAIERIWEEETMEETNHNEICLIKVFSCWGEEEALRTPLALGEEPKLIYQLSANDAEARRRLLIRLELLADILPYITQAEEKARERNSDLEYNIILDNLKTAVQLGMV